MHPPTVAPATVGGFVLLRCGIAEEAPVVRRTPPRELAPKLGIGRLTHHVLFCDGPACCDARAGRIAWGQLKRDAARVTLSGEANVLVTRCDCLKMCDRGPIAVVYPEGVWYELADADLIRRMIEEHVLQGRPVEEHVFVRDKLGRSMDHEPPAEDA